MTRGAHDEVIGKGIEKPRVQESTQLRALREERWNSQQAKEREVGCRATGKVAEHQPNHRELGRRRSITWQKAEERARKINQRPGQTRRTDWKGAKGKQKSWTPPGRWERANRR